MKPTKLTKPIVLIGMTGSGKTTVGTHLAELLGCNLLDIDRMLVEGEGHSIADIFANDGEAAFRDIETRYLREALALPHPLVISPGGGIVLRAVNRDLLRKNAHTVWLMRERNDVVANKNVLMRPPLYGDPANYDRIYMARRALYSAAANIVLANRDSRECARTIFEMIR